MNQVKPLPRKAKILKFGKIFEEDGNLVFENFHIDCAHEFGDDTVLAEPALVLVIERLQTELYELQNLTIVKD